MKRRTKLCTRRRAEAARDVCEAQALRLRPEERAALAEHLIASLDSLDDSENERLWIEEADRRYQEYKKGNISARPAADVLRDARAAIK